MKKLKFLLGIVALFFSMFSSSCKKCQTCKYGSYSEEICQDDFPSRSAWKAYISELESYGYKCN